jgi:hypothetical protein
VQIWHWDASQLAVLPWQLLLRVILAGTRLLSSKKQLHVPDSYCLKHVTQLQHCPAKPLHRQHGEITGPMLLRCWQCCCGWFDSSHLL